MANPIRAMRPSIFAVVLSTMMTLVQAQDPRPAPASQLTLDLGKGVSLQLVLIPAGTFTMGERGLTSERPHRVTITKPFYMGVSEVTQEQYEIIMGSNPSHFKSPQKPAESMDWSKARDFCDKLSAKTGHAVTLPTEAQWEYACRAGTQTTYYCGDDLNTVRKNGWISPTSEALADAPTKEVASFAPNPFGLYDMIGNVYEWCLDWYDPDFYTASPADDPVNLKPVINPGRTTPEHCLRGGSAGSPPGKARSAYRNKYPAGKHTIGFRVVVAFDK